MLFASPKAIAAMGVVAAISFLLKPVSADENTVTSANCSFSAKPDDFLNAQSRVRQTVHQRVMKLQAVARSADEATPAIVRRNFIDDEIFGTLETAGVTAAPLSTDEEFLRRITLDLTGRIPLPDDIKAFVADPSPDKRNALIDRLLSSPEFTDKWTWWLSDLLQVNATASNNNRNINGRNAYYSWIKAKVSEDASLKDLAYQCVIGSGNNYLMEEGASNFPVNSITPMGPIQDQYDAMLSKTAATFLGLGYYDCLLCHNGRGHLDQLSLWGKGTTRLDAERAAAFFSRQNIGNHPDANNRDSFFQGARLVTDRTSGTYDLNTTNGNRPPRCAPNATIASNRCSATMSMTPEYLGTGAKPVGNQTWREAFADNMWRDPMFARNFANRLWKEMFNLGLVDPVDTMDPARLDPANPPPDPWALQATHPVLLEKLAAEFARSYSLRGFLRLLVRSSAYQLSSRYDGDWKYAYVPLFARHYPRRLEGEEVHDAILKATGIPNRMTVQGWDNPVDWAMQLPEPLEPRNNGGNALNFMNAFLRGNRDTQQRSQAGSILQQLNLMNDPFVLTRNKMAASPVLKAAAAISDNNDMIDQLWLTFLARKPSDAERSQTLAFLAKAGNATQRNAAIEDLAWALMNKLEFIFSY